MDHVSRVGIFLEVVKTASFSGAGRALGMSGPAISKQIQTLEKQLGVKLLQRTTRHVSLTEEGAVYHQRARQALEDLSEAEQQIQELKSVPTGKLKVNAPMSFGTQFLTRPIAEFAAHYPQVDLEIEFSDRWVDVVKEGFDVVVRIGALEDSTLISRKLASCPILLCASPGLLEKHGVPQTVSELSTLPGIVYTQHSNKETWRYQTPAGEIHNQSINRNFSANTAEMQLQACLHGIGVSLLPVFSADRYLKSGELVSLFAECTTYPARAIYAMYPQNQYLATRTRLFIDWLNEAANGFGWNPMP